MLRPEHRIRSLSDTSGTVADTGQPAANSSLEFWNRRSPNSISGFASYCDTVNRKTLFCLVVSMPVDVRVSRQRAYPSSWQRTICCLAP